MNQVKVLLLLVLICTFCPKSYSQNCDAILSHGIRNVQVSKSTEAAIATKFFNHCNKNFSQMSDEILASAEVEVLGYGGGTAKFDRKLREQQLTDWCKQNRETAESSRSSYNESQIIYGAAVSAWDRCNSLKNSDVQIEPQISPDAKTVTIRIRYTGPTATGVQLTGVETENFTCINRVPTREGVRESKPDIPILISPETINAYCIRATPQEVQRNNTTYSVLQRGTISVLTAGQSLQLFFAEEWDPGLPIQEAEKLKRRVEELQNSINKLTQINDKLEKQFSETVNILNQTKSKLDVEATGNVHILASAICPSGWYPMEGLAS